MTKVMPQASRVPWGMATLGFFRSPEMLAPADTHREKGQSQQVHHICYTHRK